MSITFNSRAATFTIPGDVMDRFCTKTNLRETLEFHVKAFEDLPEVTTCTKMMTPRKFSPR